MEVPIIPETGIDSVVLEQITNYTSFVLERVMRYGNSIPFSMRSEHVRQIVNSFQEWYKTHPEVHSIECVKHAFVMTSGVPCLEAEDEETKIQSEQ